MKIISRKEAKALGLKRYFTGMPCKNGHVAERYMQSSNCVECQNEKANSDEGRRYRSKYMKVHKDHFNQLRKKPERKKRIRAYDRVYHARPDIKKKARARYRERFQSDMAYRIKLSLRSRLRKCLSLGKVSRRSSRVVKMLGCPTAYLVDYLESQFRAGLLIIGLSQYLKKVILSSQRRILLLMIGMLFLPDTFGVT